MTVLRVHGRGPDADIPYGAELVELLRVLVVAGLSVGIVVIGLGSRLVMFVLRVTSPDYVDGMTSDDGFTIGQVTLGGSYNLLVVGAAVGFIGAVAYVAVAPWLIGPTWFRRVTVGVTAGALGGAMLIHADGIDFTAIQPLWLAVTLFIALPATAGVALGVVADAVADPSSWTARGHRRWALPVFLLVLTPPALLVVLPVSLLVAVLLVLRRVAADRLRSSRIGATTVRAAFLSIPVLSFVALAQDLDALY